MSADRATWRDRGQIIAQLTTENERLRNLDGHIIVAAENHRADTKRGGCTCGFCAWSPEHVAIMAYLEAVGR